MKKILLGVLAAFAIAPAANAEIKEILNQNYKDLESFRDQPVIDGILTASNVGWGQFHVGDGIPTLEGTHIYTITAKIKASDATKDDFDGTTIGFALGNWGQTFTAGNMNLSKEWNEETVQIIAPTSADSFLTFQPSGFSGTIEIEYVKISVETEPFVVVEPKDGDILLSYYTGGENDKQINGWGGGTYTNVTEDDKPCVKYEKDEKNNSWECQFGLDYEQGYEPGEPLFVSFDVKGTEFSVPVGLQGSGYQGCGQFPNFDITSEWKHIVLYTVPIIDRKGLKPGRICFSVGEFVGSFYMTNVNVYNAKAGGTTGVETIAPVKVNTAVYNMQGVKVANSIDEVAVPGLYITNGKKVIKK